jgi:protein-L-isoaspartate(D-aspartate) O-methyltransferase
MVLPVGQSDEMQQLIKIVKTPQGIEYQELIDVRFVPLLPNVAEDVGD